MQKHHIWNNWSFEEKKQMEELNEEEDERQGERRGEICALVLASLEKEDLEQW
jgi:hypothetical protein